jgi:hypothetical protein
MSTYAAPPDAVGMGPPPGMGGPPHPGDPGAMAALAAALGAGPGGPADGGGLPPGLSDPSGGGLPPDLAGGDTGGDDAGLGGPLAGMSASDHVKAAIKHLMMAMTESQDDQEGHGIGKGMLALHAVLAGKAKNAKTVTAAGGTPASG